MEICRRMTRTLAAAGLAVLALSTAAGCKQEHHLLPGAAPVVKISPVMAPLLRVEPLSAATSMAKGPLRQTMELPRTPLFRGDHIQLHATGIPALHALKNLTAHKIMVMVSMDQEQRLARELADDPLTQAVFADGDTHRILMLLPDRQTLNHLAPAVHGAGVHACGRLEVLHLNHTTLSTDVWPPYYFEGVRLADAAALSEQAVEANIAASITALESLGTRFHQADGGATTQKVTQLWTDAAAGKITGLTIESYEHDNTPQKSVIAAIPGAQDDDVTVIVGAHLDSISREAASDSDPAPGADDDASGVATLTEILRVIAASGVRFNRRIELQAYAAEEVGLVGSGEIAADYAQAGRKIAGMIQLDMNAWAAEGNGDTIFVTGSRTSPRLNRSLKNLLHTYLGGNFAEGLLPPGASSDHASWTRHGYEAAFPFEDPSNYNKSLHTTNDTSTTINRTSLSRRMAGLVLAYLAHHAGLLPADTAYAQAAGTLKSGLTADLKIAVTADTDDSTLWRIAVSAPSTIRSVDICTIDAGGSMICSGDYTVTKGAAKPATAAAGRAFFATESGMTITPEMRVAVLAYDSDQKLAGHRSIRFTEKQ